MNSYNIDELITDAIEKGLSALGDNPKQATWFCLEKEFKITKQNAHSNLPKLHEGLTRLFGLGYSFLDMLFRKYLSESTGEDLVKFSSFTECVEALRRKELNSSLNPK
jgi:hypothetical protein